MIVDDLPKRKVVLKKPKAGFIENEVISDDNDDFNINSDVINRNVQQGSQLASCRAVFLCWFPCGFLDTTWCPCANHVVSCENHVVSTWKPHGIHMETMWYPPGNNVVFI